jgi:carbonic anhydrase/acetyltransferase-like protein (isoleucine patch superfamily)
VVTKILQAALFPCPHPLDGLSGTFATLPFLDGDLGHAQRYAFEKNGITLKGIHELDPKQPALLLREDVVVSPQTVSAALQAPGNSNVQFALTGLSGRFHEELRFGESTPLFIRKPSGPWQIDPDLETCTLDPKEREIKFPLPPGQFHRSTLEIPWSDLILVPCHHWVPLMWANLLALGPTLFHRLSSKNPFILGFRLAGAIWRSASVQPLRIATGFRRMGKNCRIHPSAVVEASWLGDNVEIGAQAVVRGCILGDGAGVEDQGLAEGVILQRGARVQRKAMVKFCVLGERSMAGGYLQLGLMEQESACKLTSALMDQAFGQAVEVRVGGQPYPAPLGLAGVGVGKGTIIGANVFVAPGRFVPPGLQIMPPPEVVLRRVPVGLKGRVIVRNGTLEQV